MADVKGEKREVKSKKVLGPKDLALYLGCCVALHREAGIQDLADPLILQGIIQKKNYLPEAAIVDGKSFPCYQIKPILRPLLDITDEEMTQLSKNIEASIHSIKFYDSTNDVDSVNPFLPINTKYLLSRYLDLFGWIDAGLAIDATTLSPNPYSKMSKVEGQKSKTSDLRLSTNPTSNIQH